MIFNMPSAFNGAVASPLPYARERRSTMTNETSRFGTPLHPGDDFEDRMRAAVGQSRHATTLEALGIEPTPESNEPSHDPIEQALRGAVNARDELALNTVATTAAEHLGAEPEPDTLGHDLVAALSKDQGPLEAKLAKALGIHADEFHECKCANNLREEARQILDGTFACQIHTGLSQEFARRVLERLGE
jgi:hypothetical protein